MPTWAGGAGAAGPWSAANTKVTTSVQQKQTEERFVEILNLTILDSVWH